MRISTSIDWSFFNSFLTQKRKRITLIMSMIILYALYDFIEWSHHTQMRIDDDFWSTWSWLVAIPVGIVWLWGEWKDNYWHQIIGAILFLFIGPILSMGSELRNIHIFSSTERNEMLLCIIVGLVLFALYIRSKWKEW